MKLIAAVDKNWGIGNKGRLLVNIPEDMKLFREETYGKIVVMGRKTFESLKDKTGLIGRKNIVLTRKEDYVAKNAMVCNSLEQLFDELEGADRDDVYIIGGGQIYELMLEYCSEAHITRIDYAYEADAYFPNLDKKDEWKITAMSEEKTYFDICYEFVKYEKG